MKMYVEPIVNLLYLQNEDVLTSSDNYESDIFGDKSPLFND